MRQDKNGVPLFWVELAFTWYEDAMIFRVFILIFCLELTVREQLDQNDFRHYYGNFLESTILKLPDHSYVENSFATITRHFENDIW